MRQKASCSTQGATGLPIRIRRLAQAGLPRWTYHELRHGCATLLLASGTDIAVVRDILGHSTIAVTANTYAAILPSLQRAAADRLASFIEAAGGPS